MSAITIGELAALATAMLWTLAALAWTAAGKRIGALAVAFIRLVMACGIMMLYGYLVRGRWLPGDADARIWILWGASGFFGFFVCDICFFKSMLLIGPRLALLVQSLVPPMAALLSWVCIRDALALRDWLAMGVTTAGVAWVVLERPAADGKRGDRPRLCEAPSGPFRQTGPVPLLSLRRRGIVLAVISAAALALSHVLSKAGVGNYDAVAANLVRALTALPAYAILITLLRRWPTTLAATRHVPAMTILAFGAIVGPFAAVALNLVALQRAPVGVVATIIATRPVLILPFAIFVHREKVSPRAVAGAILAVAGVALLVF